MAYDETDLAPTTTTSVAWALSWVRFWLRDTDAALELWSDTEITARLEADAWTHDGTKHYRPHVTAGALLEADPDRATSESTLGASLQTRRPEAIARTIRRQGKWVDDAIQDADPDNERPPSHLTLTPRF